MALSSLFQPDRSDTDLKWDIGMRGIHVSHRCVKTSQFVYPQELKYVKSQARFTYLMVILLEDALGWYTRNNTNTVSASLSINNAQYITLNQQRSQLCGQLRAARLIKSHVCIYVTLLVFCVHITGTLIYWTEPFIHISLPKILLYWWSTHLVCFSMVPFRKSSKSVRMCDRMCVCIYLSVSGCAHASARRRQRRYVCLPVCLSVCLSVSLLAFLSFTLCLPLIPYWVFLLPIKILPPWVLLSCKHPQPVCLLWPYNTPCDGRARSWRHLTRPTDISTYLYGEEDSLISVTLT